MVQGRGRMAGDRGRMPERRVVMLSAPAVDVLVVVSRVTLLVGAFAVGWLFAAHIDPDGLLLRYTLGWVVGEFR